MHPAAVRRMRRTAGRCMHRPVAEPSPSPHAHQESPGRRLREALVATRGVSLVESSLRAGQTRTGITAVVRACEVKILIAAGRVHRLVTETRVLRPNLMYMGNARGEQKVPKGTRAD